MAATGLLASKKDLTKAMAWLNTKCVWIYDAAWQQQRVEVFWLSLCELHIHREFLVPIGKIPAADAIGLRRYDARFSPGLIECFTRLGPEWQPSALSEHAQPCS